jgi:hypothetical protein
LHTEAMARAPKARATKEQGTVLPGSIVSLDKWTQQTGVAPVTVWRWRNKGWLSVSNIAGKLYLTTEALLEFERRLKNGEFAKEPTVPKRYGSGGAS